MFGVTCFVKGMMRPCPSYFTSGFFCLFVSFYSQCIFLGVFDLHIRLCFLPIDLFTILYISVLPPLNVLVYIYETFSFFLPNIYVYYLG